MTSMEEESSAELLKVDTKGRIRVSRERRKVLLEEYDRGGMSAMQFAQWAGVKYPTFATWIQDRRREEAKAANRGSTSEAVTWVEAVVDAGKPASSVVIVHLSCGARMEISDQRQAALAAELLRHLGGTRGC